MTPSECNTGELKTFCIAHQNSVNGSNQELKHCRSSHAHSDIHPDVIKRAKEMEINDNKAILKEHDKNCAVTHRMTARIPHHSHGPVNECT